MLWGCAVVHAVRNQGQGWAKPMVLVRVFEEPATNRPLPCVASTGPRRARISPPATPTRRGNWPPIAALRAPCRRVNSWRFLPFTLHTKYKASCLSPCAQQQPGLPHVTRRTLTVARISARSCSDIRERCMRTPILYLYTIQDTVHTSSLASNANLLCAPFSPQSPSRQECATAQQLRLRNRPNRRGPRRAVCLHPRRLGPAEQGTFRRNRP